MIFALLIAAIIWNLGAWALGIPASSSHTLIGSIIGVGIANQLMAPAGNATSGVFGGTVRRRHDHGRRHVWAAGLHNTRPVFRSGRHDGGERFRPVTVRSIALAWVLTLPAAIILSATLYYVFRLLA